MKTYLITAVGVIFISVVVSLIIPEGKLNKSITFIMRLICISVLIQPITGLFNLKNVENTVKPFDDEYVCSVYSDHQSEQLKKLLEERYEINAQCDVKVDYSDGQFKASGVEILLGKNNEELIEEIYSYLTELGYINITVYAQST